MYQNKPEDRVITPAHLMLLPLDSGSMTNFLNFKNIGVNTLQESSAFAKIRNSTKVYNSHLVHTPSTFTGKYHNLNRLFSDENDYLTTSSFGVKKQHNLGSSASYGNSFTSTTLDANSFNRFLNTNYALNSELTPTNPVTSPSPLSLHKHENSNGSEDLQRLSATLNSNTGKTPSALLRLSSYPTLLDNINDNSDKEGLAYPATKITSPSLVSGQHNNPDITFARGNVMESSSAVTDYPTTTRSNTSTSAKLYNLNGPNSKILLGDQSIRAYPDLKPNKSNYNFSTKTNTLNSNIAFASRLGRQSNTF